MGQSTNTKAGRGNALKNHNLISGALFVLLVGATACGAESTESDDDGSGGSGATMAAAGGGGGGGGNVELEVETIVDDLSQVPDVSAASVLAAELCQLIDENPNYTSNTIFSTVGKQPFANLIRNAYANSAILRDYVAASGYWAASGEPLTPEMVITQTENSCATNVGFINAICFATAPQYQAGGSYIASEAPNTGGCDEMKL